MKGEGEEGKRPTRVEVQMREEPDPKCTIHLQKLHIYLFLCQISSRDTHISGCSFLLLSSFA